VIQPDNQPRAIPEFNVMAIREAFGFLCGLGIVATNYRFTANEMAVLTDYERAVFAHGVPEKSRREHDTLSHRWRLNMRSGDLKIVSPAICRVHDKFQIRPLREKQSRPLGVKVGQHLLPDLRAMFTHERDVSIDLAGKP
jgi:hypothetical protein